MWQHIQIIKNERINIINHQFNQIDPGGVAAVVHSVDEVKVILEKHGLL
jgi:hypothetical protein